MSDHNPTKPQKPISPDWFVQGTLTKIGDIFDRLTGRGWRPSSSLATSELIERMKALLDAEVRENGKGRRIVPHIITLKMQWDKFSTDSDEAIDKLKNEFLTAAVDHINDRHYYTSAPLTVDIRPDYFTSGVKLVVGFEAFAEDERETAINVPRSQTASSSESSDPSEYPKKHRYSASLLLLFEINGRPQQKTAALENGARLSLGRTKENDLVIDDISISKYHGTFHLSDEGKLLFADTGSTNGTFVNGKRIEPGKVIEIASDDRLVFGSIKIELKLEIREAAPDRGTGEAPTEAYTIGDLSFTAKPDMIGSKHGPQINTSNEEPKLKPEE